MTMVWRAEMPDGSIRNYQSKAAARKAGGMNLVRVRIVGERAGIVRPVSS
jgi:hypothetical protein